MMSTLTLLLPCRPSRRSGEPLEERRGRVLGVGFPRARVGILRDARHELSDELLQGTLVLCRGSGSLRPGLGFLAAIDSLAVTCLHVRRFWNLVENALDGLLHQAMSLRVGE
jgi:hypothetical protein